MVVVRSDRKEQILVLFETKLKGKGKESFGRYLSYVISGRERARVKRLVAIVIKL